MRALLQRVTAASVTIENDIVGAIDAGLLILVCAMRDDNPADAERLASKVAKLRIFRDTDGKMNRSIVDCGGEALVVSQFTLAADTSRGNRPGFSHAAPPETGERLYRRFVDCLAALGIKIATGRFGAEMQVRLVNDGPVTLLIDTSA